MENASKALIIAGAILLAIIIISLGLMVTNNAKETVGSSNLNAQEIQAFNSQWESYLGTKKTANEVKALYRALIANNAAETKNGSNRWVTITSASSGKTAGVSSQPTLTEPSVDNAHTYKVVAGYDKNGLIVDIAFKAN